MGGISGGRETVYLFWYHDRRIWRFFVFRMLVYKFVTIGGI
jgi:hypothetical protein